MSVADISSTKSPNKSFWKLGFGSGVDFGTNEFGQRIRVRFLVLEFQQRCRDVEALGIAKSKTNAAFQLYRMELMEGKQWKKK